MKIENKHNEIREQNSKTVYKHIISDNHEAGYIKPDKLDYIKKEEQKIPKYIKLNI